MRELRGVLIFSDEQPHVTGHVVIEGEHFAITGWRKSPIRIEIEGWQADDNHGGQGAQERDPV
jgi:hypothetical protein